MILKRLVVCLLLAALAGGLVVYVRQQLTPPGPQEAILEESPYAGLALLLAGAGGDENLAASAIGFCLVDAGGHVVFEQHGGTACIPASTLKTVTTATALEIWGPDHRLETVLTATAPLVEGVVNGDLVIRGGGDPTLTLRDLQAWAQQLREQGLLKVTGRVLGDGRLFPGSTYDDFWNWGDIGNGYGSGVSGLNLEHNRFRVGFLSGAEVGAAATLGQVKPFVPGVEWINEVSTGPAGSGDGVVIHGGEKTPVMHLRGTVPLGESPFLVTGAVPDPPLFAAWHLKQALVQAGIQVEGAAEAGAGDETRLAKGPVLIRHSSPPLAEIITSIHAVSDNHETECLFRLLGLQAGLEGQAVVVRHWQQRGLEFQGLRMEDGCGLARADFIRPMDLARLMYLAGTGPQGAVYRGTFLSDKEGRLMWKDGAMSGVRCSTGFVTSASGQEFTYAIMINHFSSGSAAAGLRNQVIQMIRDL